MMLLPPNNLREWNPEAIKEMLRPGFLEEMGARFSRGTQMSTPTYSKREMEITGEEYADALKANELIDPFVMATEVQPGMGSTFAQAVELSAPKMSEDEWKNSEFYREEIPYQPNMTRGRAEILSEIYDNARARDALLAKSPGGPGRSVAGFVAEMIPQIFDPVNYIPTFSGATAARVTARLGQVGGRIALGAADAMVNTAIVDAALIPMMQAAGEQVTWRDAVTDIAFAGLIGSMFGAGTGYLSKRQALKEHNANLKAAAVQMVEDNEVEFVPYAGRGSRSGGMVEDISGPTPNKLTPADTGSRVSVDAFHGTGQEVVGEFAPIDHPKYGKVVFSTAEPDIAGGYAKKFEMIPGEWQPQIMPLRLQFDNPLVIDAKGQSWTKVHDAGLIAGREGGHDGVIFLNMKDSQDPDLNRPTTVYASFDNAKIQSRFAIDNQTPKVEQWPVPEEHLADLDGADQRMLSEEEPPPVEDQLDAEELAAMTEEMNDPETQADLMEAMNELNMVESRANAWTEAAKCIIETTI
jgi:hypothetical protein